MDRRDFLKGTLGVLYGVGVPGAVAQLPQDPGPLTEEKLRAAQRELELLIEDIAERSMKNGKLGEWTKATYQLYRPFNIINTEVP